MKKIIVIYVIFFINLISAQEGVYKVKSKYDFSQTIYELKEKLQERNIKIFAEIDHSAEAKSVDLILSPTKVFIIGNPKIGTNLMLEKQEVALHLPLKILVIQDKNGKSEIHYQKISSLIETYKIQESLPIAENIDKAIINILNSLE
ncbi:MAG: DUF302 domain-containing protein [Flavobacteriaceae bacterium]|nr:DUF302 domain-containing protein [Flavobacteriaceae bacterium]